MTMIADRRAVVLALCTVLALKSAASAAGFGEAGCPEGTRRVFDEYTGRYGCAPIEPVIRLLGDRPNAALAALRAGPWGERNDDSFRVVAAGWETPNLSQNLTPPDLTPPNQWKPTPAPVPVEIRPIEAARPAEPVVPVPIRAVPIDGLTPCQDLSIKARRLRTAASQCDTDIANGRPSCIVAPEFTIPRIPRSLSANEARAYAGQFESVVNQDNEHACANFGGQGTIPMAGVPTALQLPGSGVGPLYRRTWSTTIVNGKSARALMDDIKKNINKYSRGGLVADTPFKFRAGPNAYEIASGNTYGIDGPIKFNPYVKATDADANSFEFTTLAGHPEAGRVRFMTYDSPNGTVFEIRVFGHPATTADQFMYGAVGYWVQTQIWDNFTENVIRYGDGESSGIERSTIKE